MADSNDKKTTTRKTKVTATPAAKSSVQKAAVTASASAASSLPTADALKERFKAGSIPLQTDFADLIDMANIGRLAVGDSGTGRGLSLDNEFRLQLDTSQIIVKNIDLTCETDWINYDTSFDDISGHNTQLVFLSTDSTIGPTEGVDSYSDNFTTFTLPATVILNGSSSTVNVKIKGSRKIGSSDDYTRAMHVSRGGKNGQEAQLKFSLIDADKYVNSQLTIDPLLLEMRYLSGSAGTGVFKRIYQFNFTFNSSREIIPKGIITMFSGSAAPDGWAMCDGSNGTPDLRDRFIVGKGTKFTSNGEGTTKTQSTTSTGSVTVNPHALTVSEIPEHRHGYDLFDFGYSVGDRKTVYAFRPDRPSDAKKTTLYCDTAGEGKEHSHIGSVAMDGHTHDIDVVPPYFALAFIMKL